MIGARHRPVGGAIAAGHPVTTRVGADVLAAGGNACDALVAAACASWVCEPTVSGACGGGFLVYRCARTRRVIVLDFFVAEPGMGFRGQAPAMEVFDVHFGTAIQRFHIGVGSCGVFGTAAGIDEAHQRFGSLPFSQLVAPAIGLARDGVVTTPAHARLAAILEPVVTATPAARAVWAPGGRLVVPGDVTRQPALARTLERVAETGLRDLYDGALAAIISEFFADHGALLTAADLAAYRVIQRRPVRVAYRGFACATNPPPSAGGILLAYALALLGQFPAGGDPLAADGIATAAAVLREAESRRGPAFQRRLGRGGLRHLLDPAAVTAGTYRVQRALPAQELVTSRPEPRGTTHISIVDAAGNAASMTSSTGCGSGVFVADTGLHMNNMLGEEDLTGHGRPRPGARLASMMAPTLAERGDHWIVIGSSGSARIRSSIQRVLTAIIDHGLTPADAINLPRIHPGPDGLDCEYGFPAETLRLLAERGEQVVRWPDQNIYFGGAQVASRRGTTYAAAGDPRRGGDAIVIDAS